MSNFTELPVSGNVNTTVMVYVRQNCPSMFAPVAHALPAGSPLTVCGAVVGDAVEGNAHWYRVGENTFIWAGACTRLEPYPEFPERIKTNWLAIILHER
ncbi:SH3 domain-containing protein [Enterobacteriaceae bacterium RIT714]|jgi:hypothetical protein|uniref:SH3 domain-containing protein n=1 Tax=Lelliottia sp. CFBP8978 TaxID=3096522 RepID=UPI0012AC926C|nr:SH3 domain-containing protein [Lelliottia sp. CFBP8978]MDY1037171.1 SH3 domain-containing protein [Lelliottia sp. CFBP8978]MRS90564.1 SH3 domain-containing protein [Enterobacteriaceae bacterium RIT714]